MAATAGVHVEWTPLERPRVERHEFDFSQMHTPPVVGDIVGQRNTVVCLVRASLSDAVDLLGVHDRTAAGIVDDTGDLQGVLTENDLVIAYGSDVPPSTAVRSWLKSGFARLPGQGLPDQTVTPSTTLLEAAKRMRANIDSESSCHHLVVCDDEGKFQGVVSSLDLARAVFALQKLRGMTVSEVMKPRGGVLRCSPDTSFGEAARRMTSMRQNCVLVMAEDDEVLGIITPRDALRVFSDHVPLDIDVGQWLRGLQSHWESRQIASDVEVAEAAAAMAAGLMHHLLVVSPGSSDVIGVVSALDMARALANDEESGCKQA
uniref:CBS domain-containing protein n=1 Tax=Alexandrium catenella TaxID=2925 RepID=A0A7S1KVW3_ALECA|mmetsp:Transcript_101553/g.270062  ORF Transcript_101553/g.270062 Transcript_101553/m.270062 type:complete len:318 (+) Transcript_101553:79-1032(+)